MKDKLNTLNNVKKMGNKKNQNSSPSVVDPTEEKDFKNSEEKDFKSSEEKDFKNSEERLYQIVVTSLDNSSVTFYSKTIPTFNEETISIKKDEVSQINSVTESFPDGSEISVPYRSSPDLPETLNFKEISIYKVSDELKEHLKVSLERTLEQAQTELTKQSYEKFKALAFKAYTSISPEKTVVPDNLTHSEGWVDTTKTNESEGTFISTTKKFRIGRGL